MAEGDDPMTPRPPRKTAKTMEEMRAAVNAAELRGQDVGFILGRAAGLEEAARLVEKMSEWTGGHGNPPTPGPSQFAAAIRELANKGKLTP